MSHNGAQNMLGLASNTDLRVLRISHNRIRRIEGLHQLKHLEEVRYRQLSTVTVQAAAVVYEHYCSEGTYHVKSIRVYTKYYCRLLVKLLFHTGTWLFLGGTRYDRRWNADQITTTTVATVDGLRLYPKDVRTRIISVPCRRRD